MCQVHFTSGKLSWDVFYITKIFKTLEGKTMNFISRKFPEFNDLLQDKKHEPKFVTKVRNITEIIYQKHSEEIKKSIGKFEICWEVIESQFIETLSSIFEIKKTDLGREFTCFVGINPICPRSIKDGTFSVPFYVRCDTLKKLIAHEMVHFFYFTKIVKIDQHLNPGNFDKHSFEWLMSEIIAPVILSDIRIHKIVGNDTIYSYVCSKSMSETIHDLYKRIRNNEWSFEKFYLTTKEFVSQRIER